MFILFCIIPTLYLVDGLPSPSSARRTDLHHHQATATSTRLQNDVMGMGEPPTTSPAHSLYTLIKDRRLDKRREAIPLYGVHDALSAKILSRHGAPALFLSGFGVSASLLGLPDVGMTNLVEMEMVARHVFSMLSAEETAVPLIVDGDTGRQRALTASARDPSLTAITIAPRIRRPSEYTANRVQPGISRGCSCHD